MTTPQEQYWRDNDAYHARSPGNEESNFHFFRQALQHSDLRWNAKIMEFGCGTGANLRALKRLYHSATLTGVELNEKAAWAAIQDYETMADIHTGSILDPRFRHIRDPQDMTFTKGLLIHIAPADLPAAYQTLVEASDRYVLVAEYHCPTERMIPYRGKLNVLWARPFAEEIMDMHGLKLVDYGFVSKRDMHPQDDLTYFLLEKP